MALATIVKDQIGMMNPQSKQLRQNIVKVLDAIQDQSASLQVASIGIAFHILCDVCNQRQSELLESIEQIIRYCDDDEAIKELEGTRDYIKNEIREKIL